MSGSNRAVISDAEVVAFLRRHYDAIQRPPSQSMDGNANAVRQALAAFLESRVPGELPEKDFGMGWNACREQVLRGKV